MTVTPIHSSLSDSPSRRRLLHAGAYDVVVTTHPADVRAAQRLRMQTLRAEPGFATVIGDEATDLDADRFDDFCDHLLVRHLPTGRLAGCARVLPPTRAIAAGGWFTAGEFEVGELAPIAPETVELGRVVVAPDHPGGAVTGLLWTAVLGYVDTGGYRYLIGCVSGPMGSGAERGRRLEVIDCGPGVHEQKRHTQPSRVCTAVTDRRIQ